MGQIEKRNRRAEKAVAAKLQRSSDDGWRSPAVIPKTGRGGQTPGLPRLADHSHLRVGGVFLSGTLGGGRSGTPVSVPIRRKAKDKPKRGQSPALEQRERERKEARN